jgi:hypothetical protein
MLYCFGYKVFGKMENGMLILSLTVKFGGSDEQQGR